MIHIRTADEVQQLRHCGRINAQVHSAVSKALRPGVTTRELDSVAGDVIARSDARSSILNPVGFPGHICVSVNDEVGHGVPGGRMIRSGDLVKIDVSVEYQGYHTDCAVTHVIDPVSRDAISLVDTTQEALRSGIEAAVPENYVSDISHSIYQTVDQRGLSVVRRAFGHGIGTELHEAPPIANFGPPKRGPRLRKGMVLAIEPVVSAGEGRITTSDDGWTDVTIDNSLAAHFEHTVVIHEDGVEVLTLLSDDNVVGRRQRVSPDTVYRSMAKGEESALFELAAQEMDPILMAAWGRLATPEEIFGHPKAKVTVIERSPNQVAGFFVTLQNRDSIHLNTLVLAPAFQGQGLGKLAMKHIEAYANRRQLRKVTLCVQTTNQRAIQFYRRLGYESTGAPAVNTLLMERSLNK